MVALGATAVVASRDPRRQAAVVSIYGMLLAVLFFTLGAPDVGLSQLVVGTVLVPALVVLALAKVQHSSR